MPFFPDLSLVFLEDDPYTTEIDEERRLYDEDGDQDIDGDDLGQHLKDRGGEPGDWESRKAWKAIEKNAKEIGSYKGKPLEPGEHPGDGDFDLLVDKRVYNNGDDLTTAQRIAGYVRKHLARSK